MISHFHALHHLLDLLDLVLVTLAGAPLGGLYNVGEHTGRFRGFSFVEIFVGDWNIGVGVRFILPLHITSTLK